MEVSVLFYQITKSKKLFIFIILLGTLLGTTVYYMLPQKYIATGSFYVKRAVENGEGKYFTYEGYYNQQTALSYTNTVLGLFESLDVRAEALNRLGVEPTEYSLRKFNQEIKAKKMANQLITLNIKEKTPESAKNKFDALSKVTIETATKLNKDSDPFLTISPVETIPVIKETFHNIFLDMGIGIGLGLIFGVFVVSFKEYLKNS